MTSAAQRATRTPRTWADETELVTERGLEQKETVRFRLMLCQSCLHQFHWVEHRLPGHCPECGKDMLRSEKHKVIAEDPEATIVSRLEQK